MEPKIDAKNNDGLTVLILAVNEGRTKTAALLIDKGADIRVTYNGKTFFALAKEKGYEEITDEFCMNKIDKIFAEYFRNYE